MGTEISVNRFKFMPESVVTTDTGDLPTEGDEKIRLKSINKQQQIVLPFGYVTESLDDVLIQHTEDNTKEPELDTGSLRDTTNVDENRIVKDTPFAQIFNDYRLNLNNNTGGLVADFRARLSWQVSPLTVVRKIVEGKTLGPRDNAALLRLTEMGFDIRTAIEIGIRIPRNFMEGLFDDTIDSFQRALGAGVDLATGNRQEIANVDIDPGTCGVITSLSSTVPVRAESREVAILITRDDDDDLVNIDPAAFKASKTEVPLYIPSYEKMTVEALQASGVHNNFKAFVGITVKRVGLFTIARLLEFSREFFPVTLNPSEAQLARIEELGLRELARVGVTNFIPS